MMLVRYGLLAYLQHVIVCNIFTDALIRIRNVLCLGSCSRTSY